MSGKPYFIFIAAYAVVDHMRDWIFGTGDRYVSMAVLSNNNPYNVPDNIVFSFPVKIANGEW